ncbi:hypothetical protein [Actinoallomurus sp. NPDC052274]|uniref:hypothetical protein n=1 Tax=Actinoallomurus sp. NPDC052274 TaxID=3155420 RepID=UPI00343A6DB1
MATIATMAGVPRVERAEGGGGGLREEMRVFAGPRLWPALSTSTFIIGARFSAFSYFTPILTRLTGFGAGTVPVLLIAYGAATVVGNNVVGRLADRHTVGVQLGGLVPNALFLSGFALPAERHPLPCRTRPTSPRATCGFEGIRTGMTPSGELPRRTGVLEGSSCWRSSGPGSGVPGRCR